MNISPARLDNAVDANLASWRRGEGTIKGIEAALLADDAFCLEHGLAIVRKCNLALEEKMNPTTEPPLPPGIIYDPDSVHDYKKLDGSDGRYWTVDRRGFTAEELYEIAKHKLYHCKRKPAPQPEVTPYEIAYNIMRDAGVNPNTTAAVAKAIRECIQAALAQMNKEKK